ncbi:MAG: DUF3788 family protein [Cyclobacteriaceae bacterium]|nr:DUF3788 family protein [Cyclobacteriaceae bacterium]
MESIFMEKTAIPGDSDLIEKLGATYSLWNKLKKYFNDHAPNPGEEWNFPGKNYGWSFRMKSKKRNIIYFLPRQGFFLVAFVFGPKAFDKVMSSQVSEDIKNDLQNAKAYAEGRGVRIKVTDETIFNDIFTLLEIKLNS